MKVAVVGAGAIGGYLGVMLSATGQAVTLLLHRPPETDPATLRAEDLAGHVHAPGTDLVATTDRSALADVEVCLVAVKSRDTEAAVRPLAEVLPRDAVLISFQNGLRNPDRIAAVLPDHRVVAGMVTFNVVRPGASLWRQATSGPLVVGSADGDAGRRLRALQRIVAEAGLRLEVREDIRDVQAGKLLLNLNNGVCAATGATIAESVRDRILRSCFARLIREGNRVLRATGLRPRAVVGLPPALIARLLPLPDAIVLRAARSLVSIDPEARSSTLQDLLAGRPTEIDDLCGEIVARAGAHGLPAPCNQTIVDIVHDLERAEPPVPFLGPAALRARFEAAMRG